MFSLARSSLPRSALCATRSAAATPSTSAAAAVAAQGSARTFVTSLKPSLYTAEVSSTGSRAAGKATTKEGNLEITMGMPKEMGGNKGPEGGDANPEQLHAMALSTCFLSALNATHGRLFPDNKPLPKDTTVDASVSIGKAGGELPGFVLAMELRVHQDPLRAVGLDNAQILQLVKEAHALCPYSRAVKGNVEVDVRVI